MPHCGSMLPPEPQSTTSCCACRADTLTRVRGEVADLKNVMVDNIEKVGAWS